MGAVGTPAEASLSCMGNKLCRDEANTEFYERPHTQNDNVKIEAYSWENHSTPMGLAGNPITGHTVFTPDLARMDLRHYDVRDSGLQADHRHRWSLGGIEGRRILSYEQSVLA